MASKNIQTRSGNRIVALIDGKQVGLIQSIRANDDYSPEPASGIGDIHVVEYVPTMARHSLNVSNMVLNRKNLFDLGIASENGDAALQGLVFEFEIIDKDSGDLLRKYSGCTYASGDLEISKHTIVMQSASFVALDVSGIGVGV